jgi:hypothetical protein
MSLVTEQYSMRNPRAVLGCQAPVEQPSLCRYIDTTKSSLRPRVAEGPTTGALNEVF